MSKLVLYRLGDTFSISEKGGTITSQTLFADISYSDILKITDKDGYSNLERIYYSLNFEKQEEFKEEFTADLKKVGTGIDITTNYSWTVGTVILVPIDKLNRAVVARSGGSRQIVRDEDYNEINEASAFVGSEIEKIQSSPGYRQITLGDTGAEGYVKKESPQVQVWVWCRALSQQTPYSGRGLRGSNLKGRWIDISKYILSIQTSTDDNGGNFQIELPPIVGVFSESTQSWEVDSDLTWTQGREIFSKSSQFSRNSKGRLERNSFFFRNAIGENDIVLVSFEPLRDDTERVANKMVGDGLLSEFSGIYPGNYDMIGLVDTVAESSDFSSNSLSISVSGRDLSKLIIEDGSYIFPLLFQQHNWVYRDSDIVKRNIYTDSYNFYAASLYRTTREAVEWVINAISTMKIVPDSVVQETTFASEGQKEIQTSNKYAELRYSLDVDLDTSLSSINTKFGGSNPSTENISTALKEIISEVIQSNTIKYVDYMAALSPLGTPPTPENILVSNYRGISIEYIEDPNSTSSSVLDTVKVAVDLVAAEEYSDPMDIIESVGGGIWGYVKLLFDESIENRKLADSSLGRPDGSLINLIRNYVQGPWVEMVLDTWGSNYYFIFRTPPTDGKRIVELYRKGLIDNVIVEDVDVRSESLQFDNEVYSLYQLDYKGGAWGTQDMLISIMPTVILPDYAEIWGNRRMNLTTNMIPFQNSVDVSSAASMKYVRDRGIEDLMYLVNSTFYKPFTRRGTITVNGDRRLKKGTWFYYKPTNEIYYITNVTQGYVANSVDRVTTLTVERGMVLDFVLGKTINGVEYSYFNTIKSEYMEERLKNMFVESESEGSDVVIYTKSEPIFETRREIFDFFLQRKQFS